MAKSPAAAGQDDGTPAASRRVVEVELRSISFPMTDVGKCPDTNEIIDQPGAVTPRGRLAIRITTADGSTGEYVGGNETMMHQARIAAQKIVGHDAYAREWLYDSMKKKLRKSDRMGTGPIDIALWDLAGKRQGASVSQMLGSFRPRLKAYASTLFGGDGGDLATPEHYSAFAEQCHEMGYRAFKVHGWTNGDAEREAENVRLLGKRVGGRMALMLDPACYLQTFADALLVGRACDEAGFFWYEDPYADGGLSAFSHKKLREFIKTPLLMGEHVRGLESMAGMVLAGGTDMLRADPDFDMGITGTMKIAHFAEAMGIDLELHAPGPAQRHCMAAIRNTSYYELSMVGPNGHGFTGPELYTCGYSDRLQDVGADGCFPVPEGPGLGVSYDWDRIEHITKDRVVLK